MVTTIPGVRSEPGYNLLLDGVLNNAAYEAAALVCLLRVLGAAHADTGLVPAARGPGRLRQRQRGLDAVRAPAGRRAVPLGGGRRCSWRSTRWSSSRCSARSGTARVPASLWLDGLVGGLAVGALLSALAIRPILDAGEGSWAAVATTAAYPLLDLHPPAAPDRHAVDAPLAPAGRVVAAHRGPAAVRRRGRRVPLRHRAGHLRLRRARSTACGCSRSSLMALAPGWAARPAGLSLPTWALLAHAGGVDRGRAAPARARTGHGAAPLDGRAGRPRRSWSRSSGSPSRSARSSRWPRAVELALTDELTGLGQPPGPLRRRPAAGSRACSPPTRSPCCCSTSTASRTSTTASVTTRATRCCRSSARRLQGARPGIGRPGRPPRR